MLKLGIKTEPDIKKVGAKIASLNLGKWCKETIELAIKTIESYAKQVTPVDTGRLRASIGGGVYQGGHYPLGHGIKVKRMSGEIGTNVEYAPYVHWGTRYMKGRPFLSKAADFAVKKLSGKTIADRLDDHIRKELMSL